MARTWKEIQADRDRLEVEAAPLIARAAQLEREEAAKVAPWAIGGLFALGALALGVIIRSENKFKEQRKEGAA